MNLHVRQLPTWPRLYADSNRLDHRLLYRTRLPPCVCLFRHDLHFKKDRTANSTTALVLNDGINMQFKNPYIMPYVILQSHTIDFAFTACIRWSCYASRRTLLLIVNINVYHQIADAYRFKIHVLVGLEPTLPVI